MKVIHLIGLLTLVGADQCYFHFKNSSPDPIRIALRPQLHVRITNKKEFAVTPRSYHSGTFRLQIRVESQLLAKPRIHEPPTWRTVPTEWTQDFKNFMGPRFLNFFRCLSGIDRS